ncbi:tetratricopeptide repeat protein [Gaetbulibacter aestuarii]|uniref:tetratricopeptide repeat protein n=1 Tax=Gaetbulibacter aestuarii TaxID=1502358 RepID=UPI0037571336
MILISQIAFSQDYQKEFQNYFEANDTLNQLKTLKKWESINPKDAELFTSYFNYHFMKSRVEGIVFTKEQPKGESIEIKDSINQNAGYLEGQIHYKQSELLKGLKKIDEGIALYPNRLDMRFGKIYVYGQTMDWENFTSEILKTIDYSAKNNNEWTWTNNLSYDGGEQEFLLDIQNYQLQLYNSGNDELLKNMRQIANKVLQYYPDHIESLSNLSITYLLTGDYDNGIEVLLRAEKISPQDYIVLGNIALGYRQKGNKEKAIAYYEKVVEFGDEEAREFAKQQIAELRN